MSDLKQAIDLPAIATDRLTWRLLVYDVVVGVLIAGLAPQLSSGQRVAVPPGTDTVTVAAGPDYAAGALHRWLLGADYRALWTTPIRVPVLNLRTFHGGLTPTKLGGGFQAPSLHLDAHDGGEYVFRQVHKTIVFLPPGFDGTIVASLYRDQGSASHPDAAVAADLLLTAAGVLHPHPRLVVMPEDSLLGKYRGEFGGVLGWIEEFPAKAKRGAAFADASDLIDSDALLERINRDPKERVDAHAFLTAVLMDMLLGDNDRHPAQWKWARLGAGATAPWEPVARDRDKVFVSYGGTLLDLGRLAFPHLVLFADRYSAPGALFDNAMDFDRRMLAPLDRSAWDSTAAAIVRRVSDSVIDAAMATLPRAYTTSSRDIAGTLKARRERLPAVAATYYRTLWAVADLHATDAADRATIVRSGDGLVDVTLQSGTDSPWFSRRFDSRETAQIRLYLHGGDDTAIVRGEAAHSISVRIIGGNGDNLLLDSSRVGGRLAPTRLYDRGQIHDVIYADDSVAIKGNADQALNRSFNRRPWLSVAGVLSPPSEDYGARMNVSAGVDADRGLGVVGRVGLERRTYDFRTAPYASLIRAQVAYATTNRLAIDVGLTRRFESARAFFPVRAGVSQMDIVQYHGAGNAVADLRGPFYDVRATQYHLVSGLGVALNPESDITVGPIVRYTSTDSVAGRFLASTHPYGIGSIGQAGGQLRLHYDTRAAGDSVSPRAVVDVGGEGYPALWGTTRAYASVRGALSTFLTMPVATRPVVALRVGGTKLFGDFPYFDSAFLGGAGSLRTEDRQRFAGDASLYGSGDLRIPVAHFPLVFPLNVGVLGFADAGRVYVNGDSPGGWHSAVAAGFWLGVLNAATNLNVEFTSNPARRWISGIGFAF